MKITWDSSAVTAVSNAAVAVVVSADFTTAVVAVAASVVAAAAEECSVFRCCGAGFVSGEPGTSSAKLRRAISEDKLLLVCFKICRKRNSKCHAVSTVHLLCYLFVFLNWFSCSLFWLFSRAGHMWQQCWQSELETPFWLRGARLSLYFSESPKSWYVVALLSLVAMFTNCRKPSSAF